MIQYYCIAALFFNIPYLVCCLFLIIILGSDLIQILFCVCAGFLKSLVADYSLLCTSQTRKAEGCYSRMRGMGWIELCYCTPEFSMTPKAPAPESLEKKSLFCALVALTKSARAA